MILLVDIGNSDVLFGISENDKIITTFRIKTFTNKTADEYYILIKEFIKEYTLNDVIISSVVPVATSVLIGLFVKYYNINPIILIGGIKTGIKINADDPKSVGSDLICDVRGAMEYFDECLIIDLGTATKYLYAKNNTLMGVAIAPGVSISMKALVSNTALLPNIELQVPKKVLNNNTISCMQSGVLYGFASQVDGMIERIKEETGNFDLKVIITGGFAKLIAPLCKNKTTINANLVLEGLLLIYKKNIWMKEELVWII